MEKFNLTTEEEEIAFDVDLTAVGNTEKELGCCLIGKFLCDRFITSLAMFNIFRKAWRIESGL